MILQLYVLAISARENMCKGFKGIHIFIMRRKIEFQNTFNSYRTQIRQFDDCRQGKVCVIVIRGFLKVICRVFTITTMNRDFLLKK
jgi:hypothetical protein